MKVGENALRKAHLISVLSFVPFRNALSLRQRWFRVLPKFRPELTFSKRWQFPTAPSEEGRPLS